MYLVIYFSLFFFSLHSELTYFFQTSWGSRDDADTDDNMRLAPRPRRSPSLHMPPRLDGELPQHTQTALPYWPSVKQERTLPPTWQEVTEKSALLDTTAY